MKNTEKYITFTVPTEKDVTRIDKNGEGITKIYMLDIIIYWFVASCFSNLVDKISEGIHRIKCKFRHDDKECETCGIKYKCCDSFLELTNFKENLTEYNCLYCGKNYQHKFDENL